MKKKRSDVKASCNISSYESFSVSFLFRQYSILTAKILLTLVIGNELENSLYKCYS